MPQRQQCTETEVKEDYELLKGSIQTWIDNNCQDFLNNEQLGYDLIGDETTRRHGQLQSHETVLQNFRRQSNRWDEAKDQLLIAIIMRYIFDRILSRPYPLGLSGEGQAVLDRIEKNMESLEPRRGKSRRLNAKGILLIRLYRIDLQTRRNWRSDAMASLFNCHEFEYDQANSAKSLAKSLFTIVRRTLPNSPNSNSASDVIKSLLSEVIEPSLALVQKVCQYNTHPIL